MNRVTDSAGAQKPEDTALLDSIVRDLKSLAPYQLVKVAAYMEELSRPVLSEEKRRAVLLSLSGVLSGSEADDWLRAMNEGQGPIAAGK